VSHAIDEVARLADHLVLMDAGRVVAAGPLADVLARLDLPLARGEDAGVVLDAVVGERDRPWQLTGWTSAAGLQLWARDQGLPIGRAVRVRVLARDVSLARAPAGRHQHRQPAARHGRADRRRRAPGAGAGARARGHGARWWRG
jgi:molybdate transport system ATP-binding protein